MSVVDLDEPCGRYFLFRDLIEAGETWRRTRVANVPQEPETVAAIRRLAATIIDPLIDEFGRPEITYGFASPNLTRHIPGRIDPGRDQHAGHERRPNGRPVCPRLGQAADLHFEGVGSGRVSAWLTSRLPFDRLYFYGDDRPFHVSTGPDESRTVVTMFEGPSGRRIPQVRGLSWLPDQFSTDLRQKREKGDSESC